jgi:hypothetical protein
MTACEAVAAAASVATPRAPRSSRGAASSSLRSSDCRSSRATRLASSGLSRVSPMCPVKSVTLVPGCTHGSRCPRREQRGAVIPSAAHATEARARSTREHVERQPAKGARARRSTGRSGSIPLRGSDGRDPVTSTVESLHFVSASRPSGRHEAHASVAHSVRVREQARRRGRNGPAPGTRRTRGSRVRCPDPMEHVAQPPEHVFEAVRNAGEPRLRASPSGRRGSRSSAPPHDAIAAEPHVASPSPAGRPFGRVWSASGARPAALTSGRSLLSPSSERGIRSTRVHRSSSRSTPTRIDSARDREAGFGTSAVHRKRACTSSGRAVRPCMRLGGRHACAPSFEI